MLAIDAAISTEFEPIQFYMKETLAFMGNFVSEQLLQGRDDNFIRYALALSSAFCTWEGMPDPGMQRVIYRILCIYSSSDIDDLAVTPCFHVSEFLKCRFEENEEGFIRRCKHYQQTYSWLSDEYISLMLSVLSRRSRSDNYDLFKCLSQLQSMLLQRGNVVKRCGERQRSQEVWQKRQGSYRSSLNYLNYLSPLQQDCSNVAYRFHADYPSHLCLSDRHSLYCYGSGEATVYFEVCAYIDGPHDKRGEQRRSASRLEVACFPHDDISEQDLKKFAIDTQKSNRDTFLITTYPFLEYVHKMGGLKLVRDMVV